MAEVVEGQATTTTAAAAAGTVQRGFHFLAQRTQQLALELHVIASGVTLAEQPHQHEHSAGALCLFQGDVSGKHVGENGGGRGEER